PRARISTKSSVVMRYRLAKRARKDISAIYDYIARDNRRSADAVVDQMTREFELLAESPCSGELRPDLDDLIQNVRSITSGSYVVFFRPGPRGIEVVRVVHGSRDIREALG